MSGGGRRGSKIELNPEKLQDLTEIYEENQTYGRRQWLKPIIYKSIVNCTISVHLNQSWVGHVGFFKEAVDSALNFLQFKSAFP